MEFDNEALARLRAVNALTMQELEERAGLGSGVLWKLESGYTKKPHPGTIRKVAEALQVAPARLMREKRDAGKTEKAAHE